MGKCAGTPVEDDAKAGLVGAVDETRETGGIAEAGRRGVKPGCLVAPGSVERMFGNRHQLDMGEAHVEDVGDQLFGQLVPGEEIAGAVAPP
ncbi:MAG: hypothetical protein WDN06_10835 [Asticcacaulis sp.]